MKTKPMSVVAEEFGLEASDYLLYGRDKAKIDLSALQREKRGKGKLVLVSAITPTPAGEGKTTTSVGLAMGLRLRGVRAVASLREPSLGPVFGVKGGGTGGGAAQIYPQNDINLHFTGDMHAITSANNLLSALVDNALHHENVIERLGQSLDPLRVTWRRALDMNDRSLRNVLVGLGGRTGGVPRESGFDITAASEVMAVLCLAKDHADLEARLARLVVGQTRDQQMVTAADLDAAPSMTALLREALMPNLVQTLEGGPALVHGGPFANIAHGCSSVLSTKMALHYSDVVVTEGGFGFDLGAEKFLDIKCRQSGIWPDALVLVATLRALKFHGGISAKEAGAPNRAALEKGLENLERHLESARFFGLKTVVAINAFENDSKEELDLVRAKCDALGAQVALSRVFLKGGEGGLEMADALCEILDEDAPKTPKFAYELDWNYEKKIEGIAKNVYGAEGVDFEQSAKAKLSKLSQQGYDGLPVCMAKTQLSISDDATKQGRPKNFRVKVRDVRLSAGAGFVVALCGDIMTMPGLPKVPAAKNVRIEKDGSVKGLMQGE